MFDDDIFREAQEDINRMLQALGFNITLFPSGRRRVSTTDNRDGPYIEHEYNDDVLTLIIDMTKFVEETIEVELDKNMLLISAVNNNGEPFNRTYHISEFVRIPHKDWYTTKNVEFNEYNNGILTIRINIIKGIRSDIYG